MGDLGNLQGSSSCPPLVVLPICTEVTYVRLSKAHNYPPQGSLCDLPVGAAGGRRVLAAPPKRKQHLAAHCDAAAHPFSASPLSLRETVALIVR